MPLYLTADTASICLYDLNRLKHRLPDDCDWWSAPAEELVEVNAGNALIIGLEQDGTYKVDLNVGSVPLPEPRIEANLVFSSGRMYIGAGETITGQGLEPDESTGHFIDLEPGTYRVRVYKPAAFELAVVLNGTDQPGTNQFPDTIPLTLWD
jgi:hypothetical protein